MSEKSQWNPYVGRMIGSAAITSTAIFDGDGMLPIYGNADHFLYTDFEGGGATNSTYLVSPGGGVRWVNNNHLFGAYLFGDYQQTDYVQHFWVANPGIELMTPRWEFHLNGYFPTEKEKQTGGQDFADNFGQTGNVIFSGHTESDNLVIPYAMVGNGVDTAVGYSLPFRHLRARALLGGYFYSTPSEVSNITGITGTVELPLSRRTDLTVSDSYDNINHNIASVGLSLTLGGESNLLTNDVHTRLLDPMDRHIGIIETGAGTYAQQGLVDTGSGEQQQYGNVWFFTPGDASNASNTVTCGTYENPCVGLTQEKINEAGVNSRLYLASGDYNPATLGQGFTFNNNNQSIWGRTSDYKSAAQGSARPVFEDSLFLNGNNMVVSDVFVVGNSSVTNAPPNYMGIENSGNNNEIDNSSVTVDKNTISSITLVGIYNAAGSLIVNNSTINVTDTGDGSVIGIFDLGNDLIIEGGSNIVASAEGNGDSTGIQDDGGILTVENYSSIVASAEGNGDSTGIQDDGGILTVENYSSIVASAEGSGSAKGIDQDGGILTVEDYSSVSANSRNGYVWGIYNDGGSAATIKNHSSIIASSTTSSQQVYGISNRDGSVAVEGYSTVSASGVGTDVRGIDNLGSLEIKDNSSITANATGSGLAYGVINNGNATVDNSTINANNEGSGTAYALYNLNTTSGSFSVTGNSYINATQSGSGSAEIVGGSGPINFDSSVTCKVTQNGSVTSTSCS